MRFRQDIALLIALAVIVFLFTEEVFSNLNIVFLFKQLQDSLEGVDFPKIQNYDHLSNLMGTVNSHLNSRYGDERNKRWTETTIANFMETHSHRGYFSRLFLDGGFEKGCEVGVAAGSYSQHMIMDGQIKHYIIVELSPSEELRERVSELRKKLPDSEIQLIEYNPMDSETLNTIDEMDFIYLDAIMDYSHIKEELEPYYQRINQGGVLAGHDYCNYGENPLDCKGCSDVPTCGYYTGSEKKHPKLKGKRARNQNGIVKAVQEWLVEFHPDLRLYHTKENTTIHEFIDDGINPDLLQAKTRNPSWFVIKPFF